MKRFKTNADPKEFKKACKNLGAEIDPILEVKKIGQKCSCRVPLKNGKVLHTRYFEGGIIEFETEEPISRPIEHLIKPQIPNEKDFKETIEKELKKMGKKVWKE